MIQVFEIYKKIKLSFYKDSIKNWEINLIKQKQQQRERNLYKRMFENSFNQTQNSNSSAYRKILSNVNKKWDDKLITETIQRENSIENLYAEIKNLK